MGQVLSKKLTPHLQKASQKYEKALLEEVKQDLRSKQKRASAASTGFTDMNALESGFQRGASKTAREIEQEEFLVNQKKAGGESVGVGVDDEMPEDLIKFLNEAGPVERRVDKSQTSERIYDSLLEEEEERKQRELMSTTSSSSSPSATMEQTSNKRTRRRMPMVEGLQPNNDEESSSSSSSSYNEEKLVYGAKEGVEDKTYAMMMTTTERTTNFSTMEKEQEEDYMNVRLTNQDICKLFHQNFVMHDNDNKKKEEEKQQQQKMSPVETMIHLEKGVKTGGGQITPEQLHQAELVANLYIDSILPSNTSTSTSLTKEEEEAQRKLNTVKLLQNTLLYTNIPVLMKDEEDGSLVAVWENMVKERVVHSGLKVVEKEGGGGGGVRLTVENGGIEF